MKKRMFWKISLTIICLISLPLLAQQFLETRIVELDTQGKYAEALALCEKNVDLSVAAYFAAEYYYHGRKGVTRDAAKGEAHFLKALDRQLQLAEDAHPLPADTARARKTRNPHRAQGDGGAVTGFPRRTVKARESSQNFQKLFPCLMP